VLCTLQAQYAFNEQSYATSVSGLAGVLGAVIVAAIALRLGSPPALETEARKGASDPAVRSRVLADLVRPLLAMPAAFASALLAAYGYADVGGTNLPGVATSLSIFSGGELAVAAVLTLFAISWLLRDYGAHGNAVFNTKILTMAVAVIGAYFLVTSLPELAYDTHSQMTSWQLGLTIAAFVGPGGLALAVREIPAWEAENSLRRHVSSNRSVQWLCLLAILTVLSGAFALAYFSNGVGSVAPFVVNVAYLWLIGCLFAGALAMLPYPFHRLTSEGLVTDSDVPSPASPLPRSARTEAQPPST